MMLDISSLNFDKGGGFVTVVTQEHGSGTLLMVARANREAMTKTIETGEMHYTSRSRGLWHKGETSGNTQKVVALAADCDGDAVLATVEPRGPACHTGTHSCFGAGARQASSLAQLDAIVAQRALELQAGIVKSPGVPLPVASLSYTQRLLSDRNLRLKKIGEEAAELIAACADANRERAVEEAADVLYHVAVALNSVGSGITDAVLTLHRRSEARRGA